ncbi:MAG: hypothetical protein KA313_00075 [Pseudarcicella sp.]|nr:hypothetical protein [Pseudarcicella sp.]MBP6409474.1 hypothetical protein [Pseudarcicella sp.]
MNYFKVGILLLCFFSSFSQTKEKEYSRKGEFYFFWGYNRSTYLDSDITFKGKGYDFTLKDVVAKDLPVPFSVKSYFDITRLSIPQYNMRFGYFIKDDLSISFGTDHMKYIMVNDQMSTISGTISEKVSEPDIAVNPNYVGTFENQPFKIDSKDFLTFEHSDGFNYIHFELDKYGNIWQSKNEKLGLDWLAGVGTGILLPRTDAKLFGVGKNNHFKVAGYGFSIKTGLRFDFSKRFFLQSDFKAGFTHLPDIKTTSRDSDYAKQSIWFLEYYGALGYKFGRFRKNK